jgi:superfamily I DNA/RNA helicase
MTFTRQGIAEAKSRAIKKFGLKPAQMDLWRTIHSLAFQQLGLKSSIMVQPSDYKELSSLLGIHIKGTCAYEEAYMPGVPLGNKLFFLENLARIKKEPLKKVWEEYDDDDIYWEELEHVAKKYKQFKEHRSLLDFTDLLEKFSEDKYIEEFPKIDTLIIDEAQDLSKLQWIIIYSLFRKTEVVYAAGDDDQAIYKWAGADVASFLEFPGQVEILDQSFRVPRVIKNLSDRIVGDISGRKEKPFKPKKEKGKLNWIIDEEECLLSRGTWLLLCRNDFQKRRLQSVCEIWDIKPGTRVRISTIHGAKGAEAENVLLMTDMSRKTFENMDDDELRVWYVALTRSSNEINILRPRSRYYFDL